MTRKATPPGQRGHEVQPLVRVPSGEGTRSRRAEKGARASTHPDGRLSAPVFRGEGGSKRTASSGGDRGSRRIRDPRLPTRHLSPFLHATPRPFSPLEAASRGLLRGEEVSLSAVCPPRGRQPEVPCEVPGPCPAWKRSPAGQFEGEFDWSEGGTGDGRRNGNGGCFTVRAMGVRWDW